MRHLGVVILALGLAVVLSGRATADEPGTLPDHLTVEEVKAGIEQVKPQVLACAKDGETGKVVVKFTITGRGTVGSATAEGTFAGTEVGRCVEEAVKQARFRRWKGPSMSVKYPFVFK